MLNELFAEQISDEDFQRLIESQPSDLALTDARRMMIRLRQIEREREKVKDIRDAVVATYNAEIAKHDAAEKQLRDSLSAFVHRYGVARFPDVGTAYLMIQKPRITVTSEIDAKAWATEHGHTREVPDVTAAKQALLDSGEVPPEDSGLEWVPETEALVVRGA